MLEASKYRLQTYFYYTVEIINVLKNWGETTVRFENASVIKQPYYFKMEKTIDFWPLMRWVNSNIYPLHIIVDSRPPRDKATK